MDSVDEDEEPQWWRAKDENSSVIEVEQSIEDATRVIEEGKEATLDMSYRLIGEKGLQSFYKKINLNTALTKVDLTCNMLGDDGAKMFFGAIAKLPAVSRVDVAGNMIGVVGAEAVAACLSSNKSLTKLSLFHNEIQDEGATAIAKALQMNTTLHSLNLRENKITDIGASELCSTLCNQNQTLFVLWLRNNTVTTNPEDLTPLLPDSLKQKLPLLAQEQGLFYNTVSESVLQQIKQALIERNAALLQETGGGKKQSSHAAKKGKGSSDKAKKTFWTPPASPEPQDTEENEKPAGKGKKKK